MDKLRQFIALTVVGAIVLAAGGWFLLISPKRSEAADLKAQAATQEATNGGLRTQITMLKAQAKALPAKQAQLAAVAAKIPGNPALPELIKALGDAAEEANVELVSISPTAPTDFNKAAVPGAVAAAAPVAPAGTGASGAVGAPTTGAAGASAGSLKAIDLAIAVVGGYFQVEQFMDQLESLTRAVKVKTLGLAPGTNPVTPQNGSVALESSPNKTLAATITATVFMAAGRTTVAPVAAPAVGK
jgi:type IV pilus assembly protein PilO